MISQTRGDIIKSRLQKPNFSALNAAIAAHQNLDFNSTDWNIMDWFWTLIGAANVMSSLKKFLCPSDVTPSMHSSADVLTDNPAVALNYTCVWMLEKDHAGATHATRFLALLDTALRWSTAGQSRLNE